MSASIVRWGEIAWPGKNIQFDTVVNQWEINSITKAYCLPRITSPSSPYLAPPASNDCYHLNISSSHSCEFEKCPGRETRCTSCSTFYEIYLSFLPSLVVRSFIIMHPSDLRVSSYADDIAVQNWNRKLIPFGWDVWDNNCGLCGSFSFQRFFNIHDGRHFIWIAHKRER